ncbi:Methyltransferase [Pyrenophora tritici-repentis]|nr:Methyltransferase [Pyrenophora tritici-repentis]
MSENEMGESYDPTSDPEEQKLILSVLDSFRSYRRLAHLNGTHVRRQAFYSLPREHWMLLSQPPFSLLSTFSKMDDLIDLNATLAEAIFVAGFKAFLATTLDSEWVASVIPEKYANNEYAIYSLILDRLGASTTRNDMDKARSCINQFYREWSAEGAVERSACFTPVITALAEEYQVRSQSSRNPVQDPSDLHVLVPGVGLGRLVFDICQQGYMVEGNEISYHMLMASALALNETKAANQFTIAPWALNCSNHVNRSHQLKTVHVPDLHPASELAKEDGPSRLPASERLSMSTGDFCVVYGREDYRAVFDAVATVFFIDTAPNLIRYVEAVRNCLKEGGIWINLGPLLWHPPPPSKRERSEEGEEENAQQEGVEGDAGIGDPGSFELSNEEVIALVEHLGFTIEKQEVGTIETGYISNSQSMLLNTYRPSFWVARKK